MINQSSNDVIIHINFTPETVRFGGVDRKVKRASSHSFCWAEFDDGDWQPISHPLEEWLLNQINRSITDGTWNLGTVYFCIDGPGAFSNDGKGPDQSDVNNIQSSVG